MDIPPVQMDDTVSRLQEVQEKEISIGSKREQLLKCRRDEDSNRLLQRNKEDSNCGEVGDWVGCSHLLSSSSSASVPSASSSISSTASMLCTSALSP